MNNEFERQMRYTVIKWKDSLCALLKSEREQINDLSLKVADYRDRRGKPPLVCAVVESDWPEYEPTWRAIEERIKQEQEDNGQFGVGA